MRIGIAELVVIFVVALIVVGPDKLPVYARRLGEALGELKKYSDEATKDIKESIVEPLEEAQRPLREAVEPLNELDQAVRGNIKDVQKSFSDIGKPKSQPKAGVSSEKKETSAAETPQAEEPQVSTASPAETETQAETQLREEESQQASAGDIFEHKEG